MKTVPLILRPLTDEQMLQFMGRENMEDYNAVFLILLESWEAVLKSGLPCLQGRTPKAIDVARLLGWTRIRSDRGDDKMNDTAAACNAAFVLIEGGHMTRGNWW